MAIELNIPRHPYYQKVNHVKHARRCMSRRYLDTTCIGIPAQTPGATLYIDCSALPDPVPDGTPITLQWKANGVTDDFYYLSLGNETREDVLGVLATGAQASSSVNAANFIGTDIIMEPEIGVTLTDGVLLGSFSNPPPPPPEDVDWSAFDSHEELQEVVDHFVDTHELVLPDDWPDLTLAEKTRWLIANT